MESVFPCGQDETCSSIGTGFVLDRAIDWALQESVVLCSLSAIFSSVISITNDSHRNIVWFNGRKELGSVSRRYVSSVIALLVFVMIFAPACMKAESESPGAIDEPEPETEEAEHEPEEPEQEAPESEEETEEPEGEEEAVEESEVFGVGETAINEKYDITVTGARWVLTDGPDTPGAGTRWLGIGYSVENKSDTEFSVSRLVNFRLNDDAGEGSDVRLLADSATMDGWIDEGETLQGEIIFIVREGDTRWEFVFNPDAFTFPNLGFGRSHFRIRIDDVEE